MKSVLLAIFLISLTAQADNCKIAVIGFGSLIWAQTTGSSTDRAGLQIEGGWNAGGPQLPIEFARISKDLRVTLVVHPGFEPLATQFATSSYDDLEDAIENLRGREGTVTRRIHFLTQGGDHNEDLDPGIQVTISNWLSSHPEFNAVIWTGLPSNWEEKRDAPFSVAEVLAHLDALEPDALERALEYIRNAPPDIQTPVRAAVGERHPDARDE